MVAIKDFVMPSCCDNCDIFNWTDKMCHITYTRCEEPFDGKNDDCPLIEVEPQERNDEESDQTLKDIDRAFKALEERDELLDKIRERIELEKLGYPPSAGYYKAIMKCLQIIDKYRTESEVGDGNK